MKLKHVILGVSLLAFLSCKDEEKKAPTAPQIKVVEVFTEDVPIYNYFVGQVYGQEDVSINARVEGYLTGIYFDEGSRVKKGDLLYTIDPAEFNAAIAGQESKVAEAQTKFVNSENNLARVKPLAEMDAVSKSDLDYAIAERDALLSAREASEASLKMAEINLSYTKIKAPITGFIGKTQARVGEFVGRNPNPVILNTVSKVENVRVQFFLTESDYLTLARTYMNPDSKNKRKETRSKAELYLILSDESVHPYRGVIDFVNREVDASTGAILVQASFPNPNLILKPGQFAKVKILMKRKKDALLIPQRVVSELQGQKSVFVINAENKVEYRQIKISYPYKDYYIVEEGLAKNEKIVLEALQKVSSGMEVVPEITTFESQVKTINN
jgi:membrane fusion protein (multidrug efflux system)